MARSFITAHRAVALGLWLLCLSLFGLAAQGQAQEVSQDVNASGAGSASQSNAPDERPQPQVFDHATTGFDLHGAHAFVACQSCHIGGQFEGTPKNCVDCHQWNGRFNAQAKPVDHIQSSNQCDACHNPTLWQDITHVDHTQVFGNCVQCHNNVQATGKPPTHVETHNRCVECHSEISFVPAHFFHEDQGIADNCLRCHNGVQATGRGPDHIPINQPNSCHECHKGPGQFLDWTPVLRVDHSLVIGACVSCHNNVRFDGKPAGHIPASENCSACHQVFIWNDVNVDHSEIPNVENCVGCHNGGIAPGKEANPTHLETSNVCGACHRSFERWGDNVMIDLMHFRGASSVCPSAKPSLSPSLDLDPDAAKALGCNTTTAWLRPRNVSTYVGEF